MIEAGKRNAVGSLVNGVEMKVKQEAGFQVESLPVVSVGQCDTKNLSEAKSFPKISLPMPFSFLSKCFYCSR